MTLAVVVLLSLCRIEYGGALNPIDGVALLLSLYALSMLGMTIEHNDDFRKRDLDRKTATQQVAGKT